MKKKRVALLLMLVVSSVLFCQNSLIQLSAIDSPISIPESQSSYSFYLSKQLITGNGDLNGDGFTDIVICGRPINGDTLQYKIYIYFGGAQLNPQANYILESPVTDTYLSYGKSIDYSNDINGDGFSDLVVSAPEIGIFHTGRVYIYFGGNVINNQPNVILDGANYFNEIDQLNFGQCLTTAGDLNGDGYHDLAVSSLAWGQGQVNVFYGGPQFDTVSDWVKTGNFNDFLGTNISTGDFNGDGNDDLIIYSITDASSDFNVIEVFYGSVLFDSLSDWETTLSNEIIKYILLQDLNLDGFDDIIIYSEAAGLRYCLGSSIPGTIFYLLSGLDFNFTKLYFSVISDSLYLTADDYQSNQINFYHYTPSSGLEIEYLISDYFNPMGVFSISYYLGDINGDGENEILLGSAEQNQAHLKIYTNQNSDLDNDVCIFEKENNMFYYPNPFNNMLNIEIKSHRKADITLYIYNVKGQLIRKLPQVVREKNKTTIVWDGTNSNGTHMSPGIYFICLRGNQNTSIHKVVIK